MQHPPSDMYVKTLLAVENFVEADSANLGNGISVAHFGESVDGSLHHAVRVGRTFGLCQHVLDANTLEDGTHSTTGDNTGTGSSRFHKHASATVATLLCVRNSTLQDGHLDEVFLCIFGTFSNSGGDFLCFTEAVTNDAVLVTDNHDGCEAEDTTTLGHFHNSVHCNHSLFEFEVSCFYFLYICVSHSLNNLKFKTTFSSCFSQRFNSTMI